MMRIDIISKQYDPVVPEVQETSIPVDARAVTLRLNRAQWIDPSALLMVQLWVSVDGGVSYWPGGGGTAQGGSLLDRAGQPLTETMWAWSLPEVGNPNRKAKLHLMASQKFVRIACSLEFV